MGLLKAGRVSNSVMLWQSSYFIWFFLCLVMLNQIHVSSEITCNPGEMVAHSRDRCEPCPKDQYNSKHTSNNECKNCDPCESYSVQITACSSKSNTVCKCYSGFIPFDEKERICHCKKGHGIILSESGTQICKKCPPHTFTDKINSKCQPKPAEKFPGNGTSDVIDGNGVKLVVPTSSPFTSSQTSSKISTMTPTSSRNLVSTPTTSIPKPQGITKLPLWVASLAAFVLLILILKLTRRPEKKTDIIRQGSECGKPVEESGEKFI